MAFSTIAVAAIKASGSLILYPLSYPLALISPAFLAISEFTSIISTFGKNQQQYSICLKKEKSGLNQYGISLLYLLDPINVTSVLLIADS
ncbi:MAG: hypothetical protein M0Z31_04530 [Clostridia bacterium]|nr:hypothetical protein [Clostridia bacterium]